MRKKNCEKLCVYALLRKERRKEKFLKPFWSLDIYPLLHIINFDISETRSRPLQF